MGRIEIGDVLTKSNKKRKDRALERIILFIEKIDKITSSAFGLNILICNT